MNPYREPAPAPPTKPNPRPWRARVRLYTERGDLEYVDIGEFRSKWWAIIRAKLAAMKLDYITVPKYADRHGTSIGIQWQVGYFPAVPAVDAQGRQK